MEDLFNDSDELNDAQKDFIEKLEAQFCDRFTEKDEDFMKVVNDGELIPPIMDPWERSFNNNRRKRDNYNHGNYPNKRQNTYHGDRQNSHYDNRQNNRYGDRQSNRYDDRQSNRYDDRRHDRQDSHRNYYR